MNAEIVRDVITDVVAAGHHLDQWRASILPSLIDAQLAEMVIGSCTRWLQDMFQEMHEEKFGKRIENAEEATAFCLPLLKGLGQPGSNEEFNTLTQNFQASMVFMGFNIGYLVAQREADRTIQDVAVLPFQRVV